MFEISRCVAFALASGSPKDIATEPLQSNSALHVQLRTEAYISCTAH